MAPGPRAQPRIPSARMRIAVLWIATLALSWQFAEPERAQAAGAPTLMKWGFGDGGDGGPKLDEPIVTDRPDFTESSVTVGRGVVQIESGYTYVYDSDDAGSTKSHSLPESLLRIGVLADWLELRVVYNHLSETENVFGVSRTVVNGNEDLGLGIKFALTGQEGLLPEMALVPQMRVPTGSSALSAGQVLPGLNWIYGWDITERLSAGGQTQLNQKLDDVTNDPYAEFSQSFTMGLDWTDRFGSYTEWFVLSPDGADSNHAQNYFDGGMTFLVTDNVQLDARAGVGLNEAADDLFTGVGLSVRM